MDVMSPELIWIANRCYRLPNIDSKFSDDNNCEEDNFKDDDIRVNMTGLNGGETCDLDQEYEFDIAKSGRIKMSFSVPRSYWRVIIGRGGVTKKRVENDCKVVIFIPRPNENKEVTVTGNSKRDVVLARRHIDAIISAFRQKQPFTHFISIPITSDQVKNNFGQFKNKVLQSGIISRGVDETIFQIPDKLHLTIATLVLMDDSEREEAKACLQKMCNTILRPLVESHKPLMVEVRGIEYMNDDPTEVDVLYGKVKMADNSRLLQELADLVVQGLQEEGHVQNQFGRQEGVKLHVTLLNSTFRKKTLMEGEAEDRSQHGGLVKKETFDATAIMKEFGDFYFGKVQLRSLELSLRHSSSPETGYYQATYYMEL